MHNNKSYIIIKLKFSQKRISKVSNEFRDFPFFSTTLSFSPKNYDFPSHPVLMVFTCTSLNISWCEDHKRQFSIHFFWVQMVHLCEIGHNDKFFLSMLRSVLCTKLYRLTILWNSLKSDLVEQNKEIQNFAAILEICSYQKDYTCANGDVEKKKPH